MLCNLNLRALAAAALLLATARPAVAEEVFWTTPALLKDFFKSSERVSYVSLDAAANAAELRARLGYLPPKSKYTVFVARTGTRIDGYAVVDEELGQHEPITFGVKLDARGLVERTEVLAYREGYGGEVREPRFGKQFAGKSEHDAIRIGDDVVAISGATISSKSMSTGVRRALVLVALVRAQLLSEAHARTP